MAQQPDPRLAEIQRWTTMIIDGVSQKIAAFMSHRPAQAYDVTRIGANGAPMQQRIELPQAICELTDQLRVENGLRQMELDMWRADIEATVRLREEIERNRKVGESMLKEAKKSRKESEEE